MNESYARIRLLSRDELAENICGLIREARRILIHPDLQGYAKLRALAKLMDEYAPPPPPDDRAGEAGPSVTHSPALFTDLAATRAGEEVTARITSCTQVDPAGYPELLPHLPGGEVAWMRTGTLAGVLSGRGIADVTSVYLPGRMPESAFLLLQAGVPLGRALPQVRREELPQQGGRTRGILWVPGLPGPGGEQPVALATERLLI